ASGGGTSLSQRTLNLIGDMRVQWRGLDVRIDAFGAEFAARGREGDGARRAESAWRPAGKRRYSGQPALWLFGSLTPGLPERGRLRRGDGELSRRLRAGQAQRLFCGGSEPGDRRQLGRYPHLSA